MTSVAKLITEQPIPTKPRKHRARKEARLEGSPLLNCTLHIGGIELEILGVQARTTTTGSTSVHLPQFKNTDGTWQPAVRLPPEVVRPLGEAVLDHLLDVGLAREKYSVQ